jgi:opacity protein-like surface antigen
MSKNKTILAVILLLALIPLTANATITRVIGLGGEGANYIIKDAFNPNIWPQLLREWPNLAGAEFSTDGGPWDFYKAYVNYDFGEDKCVMQIALDKEPGRKYTMAPADLDAVAGTYNRLSVALGRPMGDLLVGVAINYTGKSYKADSISATVPALDISYATYGIRLGATALEKKLDLALGIEIASFSEDVGATTAIESDGSMSMAFAGRYWYTLNDRYALIPNAKFAMMKDAAKMGDDSQSETTTTFGLGIGNNWQPVENMLAIFELGLMSTSDKYESKSGSTSLSNTDSEMDIYWRLGFETKIFGWLDGRFGAQRSWQSMTVETLPGKPEIGTTNTATYLGATAHWNRLYLDLLIAEAFMQHGPYFLSGVGGQTFNRVSLKYDFGK